MTRTEDKTVASYDVLGRSTSAFARLGRLVSYEVSEYLSLKIARRKRILGGWIRSGSLTLIHARPGVGKSQFALWIAYSLAIGKAFLRWRVKRPWKVLYLDGEMHPRDLRSRLFQIQRTLGGVKGRGSLRVVSAMLGEPPMPDLASEDGQERLMALVGDAEVVIIDSLAAWDKSGREDAESWSRLTPFFHTLQRQGAAVVIIHHSGKSGKQRGTSRREADVEVAVNLVPVAGFVGGTGVHFDIHFDKRRPLGGSGSTKRAHLHRNMEGFWTWGVSIAQTSTDWHMKARELAREGLSVSDIARQVKKNKSSVSRLLSGR